MMTITSPAASNRRTAAVLVYAANLLLSIQILAARAGRVAGTQEPYLTLRFGLVLIPAALLIVGTIWLIRSVRLARWIEPLADLPRGLLALGFPILGFLSLGIGQRLLAELQPYAPALMLWLLLLTLALWALLIRPGVGESGAAGGGLRARVGGVVLLLLVSVVVPLLALEVGVRLWFGIFGTEQDRVAYIYSADEIAAKAIRFRGLPYVNFALSPTYPGHNRLGFRGPEIVTPKPAGTFRIVALGGSTTYGELLADWRETYPAQLEQILRDDYGYAQVEVVNAGVPYYTTWDTLANFEYRILDLQPDLILVYHAVNDLGARVLPPEGYQGIPSNAGIWQDTPDVGPSALYRFIAINLGLMPNPNGIRTLVRPYDPLARACCDHLTDEETAARFKANPPIYFERNLRSLIAIAQANQVQVLLSSWAYFPDVTEGDWNLQALPYRQDALAEHNAITAKLAAETGAAYYDLVGQYPYNRDFWFVDGMHMTAAGTHEQAREYAAFLDTQGLIPRHTDEFSS